MCLIPPLVVCVALAKRSSVGNAGTETVKIMSFLYKVGTVWCPKVSRFCIRKKHTASWLGWIRLNCCVREGDGEPGGVGLDGGRTSLLVYLCLCGGVGLGCLLCAPGKGCSSMAELMLCVQKVPGSVPNIG